MKQVTLIIPPVVVHHLDPHTGIPFMPHIAAYVAAVLQQSGYDVQVLDCIGLQPHHRQVVGEFMMLGLSEHEVARNISIETKVCFIYCRTMSESISVARLIASIKLFRPDMKVCLFENTQAVTSFSLRDLAGDFLKKGADVVIMGDPENRVVLLADKLIDELSIEDIPEISFLDGYGQPYFTAPSEKEVDVNDLPFPAWEIFPLEGYWTIGFAHAPICGEHFLPILTSRGCPYKCLFCIAPTLTGTWRSRLPSSVVDEMEYFYKKMDIKEFHVSDFNPSVSEERIREICNMILNRSLSLTWKLAQGTKIETIKNESTLELMAEAGCTYISFSPESGSKRILKSVNKPFDYEHGLRMTRKMNELGIRSQACFIAGLPGEKEQDRVESLNYVKKLIAAGIDEINVPVFTPVPGSGLSKAIDGYMQYAQCTFSPTWRSDYRKVNSFRYRMYLTFFLYKLKHPRKVLREIKGFLTGRFQTKMEMSFFKLIKLFALRYCPWVFKPLKYRTDQKVQ